MCTGRQRKTPKTTITVDDAIAPDYSSRNYLGSSTSTRQFSYQNTFGKRILFWFTGSNKMLAFILYAHFRISVMKKNQKRLPQLCLLHGF